MSYAEAAKSSGPIGAEKIPPPPTVEKSQPQGNIEVIPESKLSEFQTNEKQKIDMSKVKDFSKDVEKEIEEAKARGEDLLSKLIKNLKASFTKINSKVYDLGVTTKTETVKFSEFAINEFKNPVVVIQSLVGVSAIVAGYFGYLERHRVNYNNNLTLGIHASILTGLVLADGYLFNKFYPKYK